MSNIERINPKGLSEPQGYSQIVTTQGGKLIHLAGQGGIGDDGTVPENLEDETKLMFEKIAIGLNAVGATAADVVRIVVYIVDLGNINPMPVYEGIRSFFPEGYKPVSTILGVTALALPEMKVEIDVTAFLK
ncbi:uncharacterized protein METZ01_LOCUS478514 [marine metagenome]|uniref:Uncharacterized protein n=1 Tax=marine metagenome TaxID=408172 RepID=A0A383C0V3_9ZZZZ